MKALHDEIYLAKLSRVIEKNENLSNISFNTFFTLDDTDIIPSQQVVLNNASASITRLNTGVAGNKNMSAMNEILQRLGFNARDKFFTGLSNKVGF